MSMRSPGTCANVSTASSNASSSPCHRARIEAGQVFLPEDAPWLEDFKAEVLAFPYGRFDDQVDSLSQFLSWAERRKRNRGGYKIVEAGWF
jgi:hypothetical protein